MCSYATSWMHIRWATANLQLFSCSFARLGLPHWAQLDVCVCGRVGLDGMNKQPARYDLVTLTHLQRLESESIHIMREVISENEKSVMLYSAGKDSAVMLHVALKAFYPAAPPFPLLHVDTRWKFRAMYEMRDEVAKRSG